jgi:hypothetical protein
VSAQRARSAVTPDHRSAHPNIPGVPWWGAVLLAVTLTAVGFAYDAGSGGKELGMVFATTYVLGCIFAVLAVRQAGIFTAVIQPPLILFGAVPTAYFLFHGGQLGGVKDLAINCGYPLIERFPLMFFTSAVVLLLGMGRWYYGMSSRRGTARAAAKDAREKSSGRVSSVTSKVSSLLTGEPDDESADDPEATESRRKHTIERPARTAKSAASSARSPRTTKRAAPSRSPRPAAGNRGHRTGRRAPASAPHPAERAATRPSRRAASSAAHVLDTRTPQGHAADRTARRLRALRTTSALRRLSAPRAPRQQRKRDASPCLTGALPRRRRRQRQPRGVPDPAALVAQ